MKKLLIFFLLLSMAALSYSQKKPKILTDAKNQQPMLVGHCPRCYLEKNTFKVWFDKEYTEYLVDTKTLEVIKDKWADIKIVILLGTWCGDSKREVPRFYKILDLVKFKKKNLKVICVDRDKKAGMLDIESYKIQYVPTIIIFRGKAELGRIIENPVESLEKDLCKFIEKAEIEN